MREFVGQFFEIRSYFTFHFHGVWFPSGDRWIQWLWLAGTFIPRGCRGRHGWFHDGSRALVPPTVDMGGRVYLGLFVATGLGIHCHRIGTF